MTLNEWLALVPGDTIRWKDHRPDYTVEFVDGHKVVVGWDDSITKTRMTCPLFGRDRDPYRKVSAPKQPEQGSAHYKLQYEPFNVLLEWQKTWPTEVRFHLGCVLKYLARLGRKDEVLSELRKIKHYAEESIRVLEQEKK